MSNNFKYLDDKDIVLVKSSGSYVLGAEIETLRELASFLKEHNCNRFLHDHRETDVIAKTLESYQRPAVYEDLFGDHSIRAALVFRELNKDLRFLETVCRNQGWFFKIFDDYDKAIDWLSK